MIGVGSKAESSLVPRLVSVLVGAPLYIGVCAWGEAPFTGLCLLLACLAGGEMYRAYRTIGLAPNIFLIVTGALAPAAVILLRSPLGRSMPAAPLPLLLILALALIAAALWETAAASRDGEIHTGRNMAYGLLCGAYVSLFGGVALLRGCPWPGIAAAWLKLPAGAALVLLTSACAFAGDSTAFFVGRAAGKHRLAAKLSPKKSVEGLAAGMAAALAAGALFGAVLLGTARFGVVVGACAALLGPLGDLFKSALKREIGIKDFGAIIPGHGGVIDRFDSLLFTAPAVGLIVTTYPWR